VLLVELAPPGMEGLELVRAARRHLPKVAAVALMPRWQEQHLFHVVAAGAVACAGKEIVPDDLVGLLRAVSRGEQPLSDYILSHPELASHFLKQVQSLAGPPAPERPGPLSPREMEVLSYVAEGWSNKQVAAELHLSEQTVKNCLSDILRKLDAEDRTQAVVRALREGWLSLW
jgi:DNA-binding NarL/FixJ family response regulator